MSVALRSPAEGLKELDRLDCDRLAGFFRRAWHVIEPGQVYIHGWHLDAIADHLEAVTAGEIKRLLINVPPGTMKSLATSVFWPAWEWGPKNRPSTRVVAASHSERLAIRDNLKMRRLVESEWYQELWGDRVTLAADQNAKTKFENTATGFREAMPFTSMTGSRGDRVVIDDPLSVDAAGSEVQREAVNLTFRESVPTRLTNPISSAIVVIMQRLHERDVSGLIMSRELGYEHLMLPMEFELERRCATSIGFTDPRTEPGELIFPARFPRDVVERDKAVMGSYATAGQFQQRPAPREGGMFKRRWFKTLAAAPPSIERVRCWDLAATTEAPGRDPDWTVGVLMARDAHGFYTIENVERLRGSAFEVERTIVNTAARDGAAVRIGLPQDPGQAGKSQSQYLVRQLAGYVVRAERESGPKETRAAPFAAQAEAGSVRLVQAAWNDDYLAELETFPAGTHDDQVDASSAGFTMLRRAPPVPIVGHYSMRR